MKIFCLILSIVSLTANSQTMTVMTYNLRFDNPADGPNAWPNRKEKVYDVIKKSSPDVLGVQEALYQQLEDLKTNLPHMDYVGVGRDDGKQKGEFSAVFYDKTRFEVAASNTFWLSETPDVAGSKNWDAAITRVATWAKLFDKSTRDTVLVVNTHFDHIGKVAREKSATLIKEKISLLARALPVILTGDFNIEPSESPYSVLTNGDIYNLRDSGAGNTVGTFCTFKVNAEPCRRIDYIFYGVGWKVKKYAVINKNDGQFYPSDHLPVIVKLSR